MLNLNVALNRDMFGQKFPPESSQPERGQRAFSADVRAASWMQYARLSLATYNP